MDLLARIEVDGVCLGGIRLSGVLRPKQVASVGAQTKTRAWAFQLGSSCRSGVSHARCKWLPATCSPYHTSIRARLSTPVRSLLPVTRNILPTNIHEFWLFVNNSATIPCSVAERRNPLQATELLLSRGSVAPRRTFTALAQNQTNRERARKRMGVTEKSTATRPFHVASRSDATPCKFSRSSDCETSLLLRRFDERIVDAALRGIVVDAYVENRRLAV